LLKQGHGTEGFKFVGQSTLEFVNKATAITSDGIEPEEVCRVLRENFMESFRSVCFEEGDGSSDVSEEDGVVCRCGRGRDDRALEGVGSSSESGNVGRSGDNGGVSDTYS